MMNIEWNFFRFLLDAPFTAQWFHSMFFWRISKNSKFSFHATIDRWFTVMWCDIARCIAWKEIVTINYAYETKHFFLLEQTNKEQQSTKRKCHPFAFVHSFCWLKSDNPFLHSIIEPIAFLYLKKGEQQRPGGWSVANFVIDPHTHNARLVCPKIAKSGMNSMRKNNNLKW